MRALGPILAVLVLVALLISGTLYTVDQRQNAIVFQLGEI
jgi:membrane protease subunit HflC